MYYSGVIGLPFDNKEPFLYAIRLFVFLTIPHLKKLCLYNFVADCSQRCWLHSHCKQNTCTLICSALQDRTEKSKCD